MRNQANGCFRQSLHVCAVNDDGDDDDDEGVDHLFTGIFSLGYFWLKKNQKPGRISVSALSVITLARVRLPEVRGLALFVTRWQN